MDEQIGTEPTARSPSPQETTPPASTRSRAAAVASIIALLALGVAAAALWRVYVIESNGSAAQNLVRDELNARIDDLSRSLEQRKHEQDSLRARVADADGVNKSVREELLSLGERSRHLEDALANLAEQRLSGRDALALNEAEFLLQLAQERLALFHDAQAAMSAYQLADSALAAAEDPVFSGVRQAIGAEMRTLAASKPADTQAAIATLERVRVALATLPPPSHAAQETAAPSRWQAFIAQFVRIRHGDATTGFASRDIDLQRTLAAIDVRAAEAALLARDADGYAAALKRVRTAIEAQFDNQSAAVKAALEDIDRLIAMPLANAAPDLGGALRELRNLRTTRALAHPTPAPLPAPHMQMPHAATNPDGAQ